MSSAKIRILDQEFVCQNMAWFGHDEQVLGWLRSMRIPSGTPGPHPCPEEVLALQAVKLYGAELLEVEAAETQEGVIY